MHPPSRMLVDHEARSAAAPPCAARAARLGRDGEVALAAEGLERVACATRRHDFEAGLRAVGRCGRARAPLRLRRGLVGVAVPVAPDGRDARLERRHQVGNRLRRGSGRRERDLLARGLALDHREHGVAIVVAEVLGIERPGQHLDELPRDVELAL